MPIAYAIGWLFGALFEPLFVPAMVIGYWLTNITGLILLHRGVVDAVSQTQKTYTRISLAYDLIISMVYTLVIVVLAWLGILKFPG